MKVKILNLMVVEADDKVLEMLGAQEMRQYLLGRPLSAVVSGAFRKEFIPNLDKALATKKGGTITTSLRHASGKEEVDVKLKVTRDTNGPGYVVDITRTHHKDVVPTVGTDVVEDEPEKETEDAIQDDSSPGTGDEAGED